MNISLPASLADEVKAEVAENGYASVSEFIRKLVRDWQEDRILKSLKQSQRDIKNGKGIYLKSLRDLR